MDDPVLEAWQTNSRITLAFLDAIPPEALSVTPKPRARSVGAMFAHLHAVRLSWLEVAAPDLTAGLAKVAREQTADQAALRQALSGSGEAITALLRKSLAAGGKVRGFKGSPVSFLCYLVAHDAYHRAEVGILLTGAGYPLPDEAAYGQWWAWGVR